MLKILATGVIPFIGAIFLASFSNKNTLIPQSIVPTKPLIIAHRGASGHAPENTLSAINKAIEANADMIEIDVHLSKDGELIVIHDYDLSRTTNGKGKINSLNLAEIQKLEAGSWFSEQFKNEPIPTLQQVTDAVRGKTTLLIEIKGNGNMYPGIEKAVVDHISNNNMKEWCIVQSFSSSIVHRVIELDSTIETHKLIVSDVALLPWYIDDGFKLGNVFKQFSKAAGINPNKKTATKRFVQKAHQLGKKVFCWTVNDTANVQTLVKAGVDGIITNYPTELKAELEKL